MLHFLSAQWSQTRVMCSQDTNTWRLKSETWHNHCRTCWVLSDVVSVEAVYIPRDTWLPGSPVMTLIALWSWDVSSACPGLRALCRWWLCSALFMRLTPDNLLTSWSGSDLSDIRESELNFLGLLIPGPLPTHIMGKINWNKSSLDYNGSSDKWATQ